MNKTLWVAAILVIIGVAKYNAQDSVKTDLNSLEVSVRYEHYPKSLERTYMHFQYGRKIGQADIFALLGNWYHAQPGVHLC